MELLILDKNGKIFARATAENGVAGDYSLVSIENVPEYPRESPGRGKAWELMYEDGEGCWAVVDRPLSPEERLEVMEGRLDSIEYPPFVHPTGAHDAYSYGDKMTFEDGKKYESIFDGANAWSPIENPDAWRLIG